MKIYAMTAMFGKLENQTLNFGDGLNIIEAPNEWGKSTWCAFLVNMLYGIETRERSTKNTIADKDRYQPWSGAPMSGRIDLNWNGRDITIQRQTKGRLIFGDFSAFETATGIPVPELNGANCGQMLLGVERSVFTQAGFLKQADLPVVPNDALRRRLNNLVTTGDESGAGDKLATTLKNLKNKCRSNSTTGLIPQAEAQRRQLENQIAELDQLANQSTELKQRQELLEKQISYLENHQAAMAYADAKADAEKVETAQESVDLAREEFARQEAICQSLPAREVTRQNLETATRLREERMALQEQPLPPAPTDPETPERYRGCEDAKKAAAEDYAQWKTAKAQKKSRGTLQTITLITGLLICVTEIILALILSKHLLLVLSAAFALITVIICMAISGSKRSISRRMRQLQSKYAPLAPEMWEADGEAFCRTLDDHRRAMAEHEAWILHQHQAKEALDAQIDAVTGGISLAEATANWDRTLQCWQQYDIATQALHQAESRLELCQAMAKQAQPPKFEDRLTFSREETEQRLTNARFELKQLPLRMGQNQGRADALGGESEIRARLKAVNRRIAHLEDINTALELAQKALTAATTELQRRFAPRIAKRAQELFSQLTDGRYNSLMLAEDLSINTKTVDEVALGSAQVRSDGTIDQLYLALRLAVAEELTPDAPLVLDDALVRFDDKRAAAALDILENAAQSKQIILFTCQGREKKLSGGDR